MQVAHAFFLADFDRHVEDCAKRVRLPGAARDRASPADAPQPRR